MLNPILLLNGSDNESIEYSLDAIYGWDMTVFGLVSFKQLQLECCSLWGFVTMLRHHYSINIFVLHWSLNVEIRIIYLAPGGSFSYPFEKHYSPPCYMLCRDARDKIIFCCTGSESDVPHYCRKPMLQRRLIESGRKRLMTLQYQLHNECRFFCKIRKCASFVSCLCVM